jgi:hypothetical protein
MNESISVSKKATRLVVASIFIDSSKVLEISRIAPHEIEFLLEFIDEPGEVRDHDVLSILIMCSHSPVVASIQQKNSIQDHKLLT